MTRTTIDRLSNEDTRILRLGSDAIRGHTCKVLVLERAGDTPLPALDALRDRVAAGLDAVPRFRQRVVETPLRVANPVWLDDPDFDIRRHVVGVPATREGEAEPLEETVSRLMSERLDRRHPLWRLDVVERTADGSMALIWRVHHCLADGTTCVRVASHLLWDADPAHRASPEARWHPRQSPGTLDLLARGVRTHATLPRPHVLRAARGLASIPAVRRVVSRELEGSASVTPLADRVGSARTVAFAQAPLEPARLAGKAVDDAVTVNDVVLSIIAGAVRSWLGHRLGPSGSIRVKVPVSLHRVGEGEDVANHNSCFFVDLPVGEPDPVTRVLAISRETSERKLDHDAETLYRLGSHPTFARWAMSPRVFTFNVSNVRGPGADVYVAGARVRALYSLAEIAPRHALRVAVISAGGSLFFGLCADRHLVTDLHVLAEGITRANGELLAAVA